jgi:hypothetical protein
VESRRQHSKRHFSIPSNAAIAVFWTLISIEVEHNPGNCRCQHREDNKKREASLSDEKHIFAIFRSIIVNLLRSTSLGTNQSVREIHFRSSPSLILLQMAGTVFDMSSRQLL